MGRLLLIFPPRAKLESDAKLLGDRKILLALIKPWDVAAESNGAPAPVKGGVKPDQRGGAKTDHCGGGKG